MSDGKPAARNKIVRSPNRAHYDKETLYQVLDAGFLCHVSYLFEGSSVIIPTAYARKDDTIYIHGAMKNRMMNRILDQNQACVAVTHLDGMVLARSAFHHSFNYRSAVVFGTPEIIKDDNEKTMVLKMITDNILPNRWEEVREPSEKELTATLVIGIRIDEASVKIRSGAPVDDKEDYDLPIWAGELPMQLEFSDPITDPVLDHGIKMPNSVINAKKRSE
jgi:nitroimidazol reductase NimA-like FMN-containing flavoprotein (pyridoxamine 5'-phosphate oxidase superfamily)